MIADWLYNISCKSVCNNNVSNMVSNVFIVARSQYDSQKEPGAAGLLLARSSSGALLVGYIYSFFVHQLVLQLLLGLYVAINFNCLWCNNAWFYMRKLISCCWIISIVCRSLKTTLCSTSKLCLDPSMNPCYPSLDIMRWYWRCLASNQRHIDGKS